jgi:phosphoserine phosphatase
VADTTDRAMRGEIRIAEVFASRLDLVAPSRQEVAALAGEYISRVEHGAGESLAKLTNVGVRVVLISGGIRDAIVPLARHLGIPEGDVNAVSVFFAADGAYAGFDEASPLAQNDGKATIVRSLGLVRPTLGLGDGITDLELKTAIPPAVDAFAAYAGVVERQSVTGAADYVVRNFAELPAIVLG